MSIHAAVQKPLPPLKGPSANPDLYTAFPIENQVGMVNYQLSADDALRQQCQLLEAKAALYEKERAETQQKIKDLTIQNEQLQKKIHQNIGPMVKDSDTSQLTIQLQRAKEENEKFKNLIEKQNNEIIKYKSNELPSVDIEKREQLRAVKKQKTDDIFARYQKMKKNENETREKIVGLEKDIEVELAAARLEIEEKKKLDRFANLISSNEDTQPPPSNEAIENIRKQIAEVQQQLANQIKESEGMKPKMIELGIKSISFEKPDDPYIEEEDESDFTLAEIRDRINKIRKMKNHYQEQFLLKKRESEDQEWRFSKIKDVVDSLISKRVIQPKK